MTAFLQEAAICRILRRAAGVCPIVIFRPALCDTRRSWQVAVSESGTCTRRLRIRVLNHTKTQRLKGADCRQAGGDHYSISRYLSAWRKARAKYIVARLVSLPKR